MRSWRQILIVVTLGLLTAIAVSWALAGWRNVPMFPSPQQATTIHSTFIRWNRAWDVVEKRFIGATDLWWLDLAADDPGMAPFNLHEKNRLRWMVRRNNEPDIPDLLEQPPPEILIGTDTAFGWPMPCLWMQVTAQIQGNATVNPKLRGAIFVSGRLDTPGYTTFRALPFLPIWRALLIDAALYALIWYLILFAPGVLRRSYRRRHNCCERCGYSLAGQPSSASGCPECGWRR